MIRNVILRAIASDTIQITLISTVVFFFFSFFYGKFYYPILITLMISRLGINQIANISFANSGQSFGKKLFLTLGAVLIDTFVCIFLLSETDAVEAGTITSILVSCLLLSADTLIENFGQQKDKTQQKLRVLAYGSERNPLLMSYINQHSASIEVAGYIEENVANFNRKEAKNTFRGGIEKLDHFVFSTNAQQLIISSDELSAQKIKIALQICLKHKISPVIIGNKFDGEFTNLTQTTPSIKLEELLNRPPVDVNLLPIEEMISGKVVMVTGGGGSIGSELCRQIIKMNPAKLIIADHSELNLYNIGQELKDRANKILLLIDLKDVDCLKEAFFLHQPQILFHAAAYKHVHLVEENPYPSIINNILGTKNLIECSLENNISTFVLISSDKAVNPSSVMGATKRVCELMVTKAAKISGKRYCSVRFGNVLGSSGSLIPLLEKQINSGGPVTITDPKMTRYFMLISEAVKLVLKAGQISSPGDIYVLKMGEPIKILDLAKRVIHLMGRTENEIPIVFIGKKPGEKLFEELYLVGNEAVTEHPDILIVPNGDSEYDASLFEGEELEFVAHKLIHLAYAHDDLALKLLNKLVFMHKKNEISRHVRSTNLSHAV